MIWNNYLCPSNGWLIPWQPKRPLHSFPESLFPGLVSFISPWQTCLNFRAAGHSGFWSGRWNWVSASPHTLSRAERSQANQSIKNIIVVLAWQTTQKNWIFQTTHYQDLSSLYYIHRYICISMHMLICTWAHTHTYMFIYIIHIMYLSYL